LGQGWASGRCSVCATTLVGRLVRVHAASNMRGRDGDIRGHVRFVVEQAISEYPSRLRAIHLQSIVRAQFAVPQTQLIEPTSKAKDHGSFQPEEQERRRTDTGRAHSNPFRRQESAEQSGRSPRRARPSRRLLSRLSVRVSLPSRSQRSPPSAKHPLTHSIAPHHQSTASHQPAHPLRKCNMRPWRTQ
jgi:hypothetical protein